MSGKELEAGKRWVEQCFEEIATQSGALGNVAPGDRWRMLDRFKTHTRSMTYYAEFRGHVKRGQIVFRDVDLEGAGAGDTAVQEELVVHMRSALGLFQ